MTRFTAGYGTNFLEPGDRDMPRLLLHYKSLDAGQALHSENGLYLGSAVAGVVLVSHSYSNDFNAGDESGFAEKATLCRNAYNLHKYFRKEIESYRSMILKRRW
jgi:hypothetical protein